MNKFEKKYSHHKIRILGCDKTIPLNRIASRDSESLGVSRRNRAKDSNEKGRG
jgi:hypothetical protein